ncbi:IMPACT family protein [Methanococcus sp. CF]
MDENSYKTLKSFSKVELAFKGSLFIGYGKPVKSEMEAKEFINEIKAIHSDATHNVSAYRVDIENNFAIKYDDDFEPQGSAGKPIYKVIELKNLQNIIIVVTRYFGGVKLGYGGLVKAYSDTANEVINSCGILEVFEKSYVTLEFDYSEIQKVKDISQTFGKIVEENYFDVVKFKIELKKGLEDEFTKKLVNITKNKIKIDNL